jgi:hypothetical protein
LSKNLPNSNKAIIVVGESDQYSDDEVLKSPGASVETKAGNSYASNDPKVCYRVGPFSDEKSASRLLKTLASMDVASSSIDIEINQRPSKYIVLTSKQSGSRTPQQLEKKFRNSGVKDVFLVKSGRNKGRISLGIYNGPISAGRRLDSLNSIGIDLEVVEVKRELSTAWVNMALNSTRKSRSDLQSTVASVEPEAAVQKAECDQQQFAQLKKNNT